MKKVNRILAVFLCFMICFSVLISGQTKQTVVYADGGENICLYGETLVDMFNQYHYAALDDSDYEDTDEVYLVGGITDISFIDLDGDGLEELFVSVNPNDEDAFINIYTYYSNAVHQIYSGPGSSRMYDPASYLDIIKIGNKKYFVGKSDTEDAYFYYYSLTNHKLKIERKITTPTDFWKIADSNSYYSLFIDCTDDLEEAKKRTRSKVSEIARYNRCKYEYPHTSLIFKDVSNFQSYYFAPVYWAYEQGITVGYGAPDRFSPYAACTREQIVTFLWRMMESPEPATHPTFTDVKAGAWYEKPIQWAAENGITVGLNDGTGRFGVGQACTREMCVSFLWRAAGKPNVVSDKSFVDVPEKAYYYMPVLWAAENGITVGLNDGTGRFGTGQKCTRGMIVSFLYRYAHLDSNN